MPSGGFNCLAAHVLYHNMSPSLHSTRPCVWLDNWAKWTVWLVTRSGLRDTTNSYIRMWLGLWAIWVFTLDVNVDEATRMPRHKAGANQWVWNRAHSGYVKHVPLTLVPLADARTFIRDRAQHKEPEELHDQKSILARYRQLKTAVRK